MRNRLLATLLLVSQAALGEPSHPPLRKPLEPANRPRNSGPAYFVDPVKGNDQTEGSEQAPWKSAARAIEKLKAGDTLYLRGGVYYEALRVCLVGEQEAPITIRSYPGEQAVIDAGFREFFDSPQTAWMPYAKGGKDEYRSTRPYPNLRHVVGSFGDSMIGLNTYYHAMDLRAQSEYMTGGKGKDETTDIDPVYCGPGVWHDPATGYIHVRLAHTHLEGMPNYRGPTDPRKVPLVLSEFRSVPLALDGARHVIVQDLVIRGAGHNAVVLDNVNDSRLEGLTIWAGSYGIRGHGTQRLKISHCAVYGNVQTWTFRTDTSMI
jgi:hypothetical protein